MKRILTLMLVLSALSGLFLTSCGDDDSTESESGSSTDGTAAAAPLLGLEGSITVSGAQSLADALGRIGEDFMAANPAVEVSFTFDSSATLATQILEGAPADVIMFASSAEMIRLTDAGLIAGKPVVFARNKLIIITKPGNPERIGSLADLADAGVISLCGEGVPCGRYAKAALTTAGVVLPESNVTRGRNAGATLIAVAEGDAAAGIVYVTDALGAGDTVDSVELPDGENVVADYPIGVLEASTSSAIADAFRSYVLSDEGQTTLADFGFLGPT
ncbi:MAG: molybdate ABC transporter substrate-binding protein [Acidimicrobiales bacterium]